MKNLRLIFYTGILFFSTCVYSACNNQILNGLYNVESKGVVSGNSVNIVGRIRFDGITFADFTFFQSRAGSVGALIGTSVMYGVTGACTLSGIINWSNGTSSRYYIFLDQIDNNSSTPTAYHGEILTWGSGISTSGSLTRMVGKF